VDQRDECGAADKAENLARCKSSYCQLPGFGQLVDPVRAEATTHVLPGCQSLGRPAAACAAVGTTWEASKFGGLNIKEYLQPRKLSPRKVVFVGSSGTADPNAFVGKADDAEEETGTCTPWDRRGMGSGNRRKILRHNVGKVLLAAGADSNRQRLRELGHGQSRGEVTGLAHESVRAMRGR
jgi:hypothetical protein